MKDIVINILFKKKLSLNTILLYHSYDKSLLPDILFENYSSNHNS